MCQTIIDQVSLFHKDNYKATMYHTFLQNFEQWNIYYLEGKSA